MLTLFMLNCFTSCDTHLVFVISGSGPVYSLHLCCGHLSADRHSILRVFPIAKGVHWRCKPSYYHGVLHFNSALIPCAAANPIWQWLRTAYESFNIGSKRVNPLVLGVAICYYGTELTHWGRDKMDAISQTIFSNAFSWMKMFQLLLKFHWSLFPRV